jgi:hypothetical protein
MNYAFTLADGQKIAGTVQQPLCVRPPGRDDPEADVQFILHERDKGPLGAKLTALVYVKHVYLGPEALDRGKELAAKRPASRPAR